ncbi:MAG: hypothetical protein EBR82_28495 [Caulobacteraceae bacterium]|nr:hypothetical protein [Caulobacteraceae bacterium]
MAGGYQEKINCCSANSICAVKPANSSNTYSRLRNIALLMTCCLCTACSTTLSRTSQLYDQPELLTLPAGLPVATRDGVYTPVTDERYYSQRAYNRALAQSLWTGTSQ